MWVAIILGVAIAMGIGAAIWKPSTPAGQEIQKEVEDASKAIIEEELQEVIKPNKS